MVGNQFYMVTLTMMATAEAGVTRAVDGIAVPVHSVAARNGVARAIALRIIAFESVEIMLKRRYLGLGLSQVRHGQANAEGICRRLARCIVIVHPVSKFPTLVGPPSPRPPIFSVGRWVPNFQGRREPPQYPRDR